MLLLFAILISSCSPSSPTDLYPTYDPFAPLNGTTAPGRSQSVKISLCKVRRPHTYARLLSVPIPNATHNSAGTTTQRLTRRIRFRHSVTSWINIRSRPGIRLAVSRSAIGISLEALMQANGLNEASILSIGIVLHIPPIDADPNPGSSFKIIPDSELVLWASQLWNSMCDAFAQNHSGYLANYVQDVDGEYYKRRSRSSRVSRKIIRSIRVCFLRCLNIEADG